MPRYEELIHGAKPTTYKRTTEPTTGSWLDKLFPFLKGEIKEPKVIEEPKITESREYVVGQPSEEEEERRLQFKEVKKQYRDYFLTQTNIGEHKEWADYISRANLPELENLYGEYQEWQQQRQEQMITQFAEQLGIPSSYLEQMKGAYPPEELESRLTGLGGWMDLMKTKPTIGAYENIMETLFPKQEPTLEDKIRTGEIPASQLEALEQLGLLPEGMEMKEKEPAVEEKADEIMKVNQKIEEEGLELFELPIDYLLKYEMLNYVPVTDFIRELTKQGYSVQEPIESIAGEIQGGTPIEELIPLVMETQGVSEKIANLYILKAQEWLSQGMVE